MSPARKRAGSRKRRTARAAPAASECASAEPSPDDSVQSLHGVGPVRARALARLGVSTVGDLLRLVPRRLEAVGPPVSLAELGDHIGGTVFVRAAVRGARFVRGRRRRSVLRVRLEDDSGSADAVFFNQPWMRDALPRDEPLDFYGSVVDARGPALVSPRRAAPGDDGLIPGRLRPIYPTADGLGQGVVADLVRRAVEIVGARAEREVLPPDARAAFGVGDLGQALVDLHAPASERDFSRARRRLALEPLLTLQAQLQERLAARSSGRALPVAVDDGEHRQLVDSMPFTPTDGQRTVLEELRRDLARPAPMRRLLQGDVGSGKTALGLYACRAVAARGAQAAFMAPTELLAEQHFEGQAPLLERAGLRVALLTGSLAAGPRRELLEQIASGAVDVVFGTHALFSRGVRFATLALAVVDEQHRFGVAQRRDLFSKGRDVHVLLMTATPIPRTLALTLYGDLEVSVLRERPPGRQALRTRRLTAPDVPKLLGFLERRLSRGERAFWVCPRIETSENGRGAEEAWGWLEGSPLARHGIGLVHGRLPADERSRRLSAFRRGELRLLVGTTVLEVGVDVPEATVIVIEGAERFGLAQLHQLRGRVGRGAVGGHCFLFGSDVAAERLELLASTEDGFALAEADLAQRGMGDLIGKRQAGFDDDGALGSEIDLDLVGRARDLVARDAAVRRHYLERAAAVSRRA